MQPYENKLRVCTCSYCGGKKRLKSKKSARQKAKKEIKRELQFQGTIRRGKAKSS